MFDLKKCEKMKKADIYRYNKIVFDKEYNFYGLTDLQGYTNHYNID